jgi:flagellar biosynthesis regulator FlbT
MKKFGVIKSKLLNKLTESYANENKAEIKNILTTIKENKNFKEMYLFYEEIENKYIDDKETAQLYVEGVAGILKQQMDEITNFCTSLNKLINVDAINENEIYSSLDTLVENDSLSNIEKKVKAKKKLVEHLTTKKEITESKDATLVPNETLLNAVLANNFNVLYSNTLSESEKEELKNIMSLPYEDLINKTQELKESITTQVSNLINESKDSEILSKLNRVKDEVSEMLPSRYNFYRLNELKNGLN